MRKVMVVIMVVILLAASLAGAHQETFKYEIPFDTLVEYMDHEFKVCEHELEAKLEGNFHYGWPADQWGYFQVYSAYDAYDFAHKFLGNIDRGIELAKRFATKHNSVHLPGSDVFSVCVQDGIDDIRKHWREVEFKNDDENDLTPFMSKDEVRAYNIVLLDKVKAIASGCIAKAKAAGEGI